VLVALLDVESDELVVASALFARTAISLPINPYLNQAP
jgi:hypothetical protein